MKKITSLLCILAAFCLTASAQYYYLPNVNAGTNPGGINTDAEYPVGGGLPAGWTQLTTVSPVATPAWTANQTIPFSFSFNGSPVTQYKVSSSGVLTFDVATALAAPSYTRAALPNAAIPNSSVCIWGLSALGTNDYIISKTFGTAPNRQHWIQFSSYSYGSTASDGSNFTYWSMVLEETSNNIYIVDNRTGGFAGTNMVSAGVQINSTTATSVAGSPNLASVATTDPSPADNTYYTFIYGTQPTNDAMLLSLTTPPYASSPSNVNITGSIRNLGSATINIITIKYQSGVNVYTYNANLNITSGNTANFTHTTPLSIPAPGNYPIKVWLELTGDNNHLNDTLNTIIAGAAFTPSHNVVIEEATGTWCGWCPRGAVYVDSIEGLYPNSAFGVAVHDADSMSVSAYDAAVSALIGGYPSGLVNRKDIDIDPTGFIASYQQRINDFGVANMSVSTSYNSTTHVISATVTANFAVDLSGDYRLGAIVTEDHITGQGDGTNTNNIDYDQENYYSYQSNNLPLVGAGRDWQAATNPVNHSIIEFNHVGRAILGGFAGQAGSLPSTISANATHSYTFTYTVPTAPHAYNPINMHIIGILIAPPVPPSTTGEILNSARADVLTSVPVVSSENFTVNVYPNPMSSAGVVQLNLTKAAKVNFEIVDMTGKLILSRNSELSAGKFNYNLSSENLGNGLYNAKITVGKETITKRFTVAK